MALTITRRIEHSNNLLLVRERERLHLYEHPILEVDLMRI
jgi:hypothetical protein